MHLAIFFNLFSDNQYAFSNNCYWYICLDCDGHSATSPDPVLPLCQLFFLTQESKAIWLSSRIKKEVESVNMKQNN